MRTRLIFGILVLFGASGLKAQNPTWADDVACILYSHCSSCHNPNGSAPFSLMTYADAVNNANYMKIKVESREMPPWPVDNAYRKFAHDRSLSDAERATIIQWVNSGKPQGNPANAPAPPVYGSNLQIPAPDLKLQMPTYTLPAITEDLYRCFVLPTGLSAQKFITDIEIIPGNHGIVHHAQVFYDTTGVCQTLDNADPGYGYTSAGGVGTPAAVLLGTWVPGSSPIFVPNGMGKRLPASAKIVIQIHYPEYAGGRTDSTKVHFLFTGNTVRNISDAAVLNHITSIDNGPLFIPKNTVKTFYESYTVPINATLLSVGPHGHLICRSMKAWGVTLLGDTIPIINIPEWDFHWQGSYDFQKPLRIPFGTKLYGEATYDNTAANPHNPSDPPEDVRAGEATTDEMMLFYFSFLPYQNGDENIVIDTAGHKPHHLNCVSDDRSSVNAPELPPVFTLMPNPASSGFRIQANQTGDYTIELMDPLGRILFEGGNTDYIDTEALDAGIYMVRIQQNGLVSVLKLQKE